MNSFLGIGFFHLLFMLMCDIMLVLEEIFMGKATVSSFHIPRWNELPNLDLYLDQLVTIMEKNLKEYIRE